MRDRHTGTVKWFNSTKGFGFIKPDDQNVNGGSDVFVHINDLNSSGLNSLEDNQSVNFFLEEHKGKTKASNIKLEG